MIKGLLSAPLLAVGPNISWSTIELDIKHTCVQSRGRQVSCTRGNN
jgi:hypothetical protein